MNATSKGPEGHNSKEPHTVRVDLRLMWSKGALKMLIAAVLVAAGGVLAFFDKVVASLMSMAPMAAFVAILAVNNPTSETPVTAFGGLQLPAPMGLASRFVVPSYDNTRKVFRHA